ncbi:unnamed protein product [Rhizophagus irregularis]|uniref:Galactose oxidase n=1 Tax=Rhizophagus irregularis TaxID=588596 RepID=A0A2N1MXM1_9GLOM|nr:galactose oxidase [Rhizophagus irregularis]CAB4395025.1 unnamed protein product [Rhizophagus irregularis]CAB5359291.1 unnamed protein product [Rhizophagus irregularis]
MIFLNNSLIYIITFGSLLQLLVEVKSQITKPDLRLAHTATLIDDKLYILGGEIPPRNSGNQPKETFLYLDVSTPFSTNEVKYTDLSNSNVVPSHRYSIAIKGGANNSTLFLYGGTTFGNQTMELVYAFDAQHSAWYVPKPTGDPPVGKDFMFPVIDDNGLLYMFGGNSPVGYVNDMFILDTIYFNWNKSSAINPPRRRDGYSAVFLPNKTIVYLGGFGPSGPNGSGPISWLPLDEVYLYDTINSSWEAKKVDGTIPAPRAAFSAVLGPDAQRVIIFGGDTNSTSKKVLYSENALYVLNLNTIKWHSPPTSGKTPSSRAFHRSLTIGKYMVVTFGYGYTRESENDILLLDISNNDEYVWTTKFEPQSLISTPQLPTPQSLSHSNINITGIAIGTLIGIICGIALTIGSFFLYKQYKNRSEVMPTPGDEITNKYPEETLKERSAVVEKKSWNNYFQ